MTRVSLDRKLPHQSRLGNSSNFMKYRDKLCVPMAGHNSSEYAQHCGLQRTEALKSCQSEFHRILWCDPFL